MKNKIKITTIAASLLIFGNSLSAIGFLESWRISAGTGLSDYAGKNLSSTKKAWLFPVPRILIDTNKIQNSWSNPVTKFLCSSKGEQSLGLEYSLSATGNDSTDLTFHQIGLSLDCTFNSGLAPYVQIRGGMSHAVLNPITSTAAAGTTWGPYLGGRLGLFIPVPIVPFVDLRVTSGVDILFYSGATGSRHYTTEIAIVSMRF